jgi:endonuclease/exonuclease/phosphatase family metal-dependent hydrolase
MTGPGLLPAGGEPAEGRQLLGALVETEWGSLPFFTTQLNSSPAQSATRCEQVRAMADLVASVGPKAWPSVVTGDFNAQPESDEIRLFEGHLTAPAVRGLVLIDAWRYAAADDRGLTWDRQNPHVAATFEPSARIDYIFVSPPTADGRGHVRSVTMMGSDAVDGVWPSDHFGVVAELAAR